MVVRHRFRRWGSRFLLSLLVPAVFWAAGALLIDGPGGPVGRWGSTAAWLVAVFLLVWRLRPIPKAAATVVMGCLSIWCWWLTLQPMNDRNWSPEYENAPWAVIDGDSVTIHNFRNNDYRSETDFDTHWETRTFHLSKLQGTSFFINYWGSPHIAHTLLSFDFGDEGVVCTSIETRREKGESYSALLGFYRQFELYYVIGDERDLIRVRTNFRHGEDVYLYPLQRITPENARMLFLTYLDQANQLREHPRWYNAATNNCTTNIQVNARTSHVSGPWDWRILINGHVDEMLYERCDIPCDQPFGKFKQQSSINARARAVTNLAEFSQRIRDITPK